MTRPTGLPPEIVLSRANLDELRASAISDEVITGRGYRTLYRPDNTDSRPQEELKRAGIPSWAFREDRLFPMLVIPRYNPDTSFDGITVKPRTAAAGPDGKPRKYAHPKGSKNTLDVHPFNRDRVADPTVPLFVVEGVKKADAVTSTGRCAVAVNGVYGWRRSSGAEAVWESVPIKGRQVVLCFDSDTNERLDLQRAVGRLGAWLKSKGAVVTYVVIPAIEPPLKAGIDDWLASGRAIEELERVAHLTPPIVDEGGRFTDAKLCDHFVERALADEFLYGRGLGWLRWDGRRWQQCGDERPLDAIRTTAMAEFDHLLDDAKSNPDKLIMAELFKKVLSANRLSSILKLTRGHGDAAVDADEFDRRPDLLNVANGVVDLRTGELMPHDPALRMTKLTGIEYRPGFTHPDWTEALKAVPAEDVEWLQDRFGQAVTGEMTADDRVVIAQGGGSNGKSTVLQAVLAAVGEHGKVIPDKALTARAGEHSTELTVFKGLRLALLEELPDGSHVNRDRLVKIAGTSMMTARRIGEDNITWRASHSLFITTNHRVDIRDVDHGTWRRLAFARFPYRYRRAGEVMEGPRDRVGDPTLRERLLSSPDALAAVLSWCVEGAVRYYRRGAMLPMPEGVRDELEHQRDEVDVVGAFLRDMTVIDTSGCVRIDELAAQFNRWSERRGYGGVNLTTFATRLGAHPIVAENRMTKARVRAASVNVSKPPSRELIDEPEQVRIMKGMRFVEAGHDHVRFNEGLRLA